METSHAESQPLDFNNSNRTSASKHTIAPGGVPKAIRDTAQGAGLDPIAELYNEALNFATEGHLRLARERLQMLLCMSPNDGEARLLLAKVYVAGQRWQEALAALDEAQNCNQTIPPRLRSAIETHLHKQQDVKDEHRTAMRAREQGEIKSLRQEARRLRSENAQLVGRTSDLEKELKKWAWTTAAVSCVAVVFIAVNLLGGATTPQHSEVALQAPISTPPAVVAVRTPEVVETPAITPQPTPSPTPVSSNDIAQQLSTMPQLEGANITVKLSGTEASLSGTVLTSAQRYHAKTQLLGMSKIESVNTEKLTVKARSAGTSHTVKKGDTLSHIARYYYGDSTLTKPIAQANRSTLGKNTTLSIGQSLLIPAVD